MYKRSKADWAFDAFLYGFMLLLAFCFIFPFWTVIVMSLNDATDLMRGGVYFWPRVFSMSNYKAVIENKQIVSAYLVTISRTVLGTALHILATGTFAYALSKKKLMFRNFYFALCVITMFFGGGLIPAVINMRNLGFMNNYLVYVIPGLYSVMDMIIMKSFFNSLPPSLEEAATIDGANDLTVFFRVVVPNTTPVIATIALMTAVGHWNSWFDAYLYITEKKLWPLQLLLQQIVLSAQNAAKFIEGTPAIATGSVTPYSVQLATLVAAIGPIILIYPFFQRFFVKGFMIGAIKE